jgi:hypothetical protein
LILVDKNQVILVQLLNATNKKLKQKLVPHLKDKKVRNITRYGEKDFLIATAKDQDKSIALRHSEDAALKIKIPFRY